MVSEYNVIAIDVKMEDLDDKKIWFLTIQDSLGEYRGKDLAIDIDNIRDSNGTVALKTLIHETRHQIQKELAEKYRTEGDNIQLPSDISLEQVKSWSENFGNYVRPSYDYEGYRKQPIEQDARDFADNYMEEVFQKQFGIY